MADKILIDNDDGRGLEYEPTDSEDNYSDEEKELLQNVRKGRKRKEIGKKELMAFQDSEDDDIADLMRESDIEGGSEVNEDEDLPDSKNWGRRTRDYYGTDFVDPDYSTWTAEEEVMAKLEEEEAMKIQNRLLKDMREEDFVFDDFGFSKNTTEDASAGTTVKPTFAGLSLKERRQLFEQDSPEFYHLTTQFTNYLTDVKTIIAPILSYGKEHNVIIVPPLKFAHFYQNLALTYCSNIVFYLLLKTKRVSVKCHPITKRLVELRHLLVQLEGSYENIIKPQLEALLERIIDGDKFDVLPTEIATKMTKDEKYGSTSGKKSSMSVTEYSEDELGDKNVAEAFDDEQLSTDDARRSITYQIAKNKGLMPHRKKELRNPRVKHRSKFRKALIRRKGAVRTVRKETTRYGGETSGIKATVSKSIKFKV